MLENQKEDNYTEISHLKEEIKSKENSKKEIENIKNNKALTIFGNNINDRRPKYYGKTKSIFYFNEKPIFILGEDSNFLFIYFYKFFKFNFYSFLWIWSFGIINFILYYYLFYYFTKKL